MPFHRWTRRSRSARADDGSRCLGQVARPPAPPRSYPHTILHQIEFSFASCASSPSVRAPLSPEARRAPPLCLTGDGSRTVKTRSVPIVSQATPLSLCLAANNAHPMLHQIALSCPPPCHRSIPARERLPAMGHQQNERSQSFSGIKRKSSTGRTRSDGGYSLDARVTT